MIFGMEFGIVASIINFFQKLTLVCFVWVLRDVRIPQEIARVCAFFFDVLETCTQANQRILGDP